jgi:hypothetical protein
MAKTNFENFKSTNCQSGWLMKFGTSLTNGNHLRKILSVSRCLVQPIVLVQTSRKALAVAVSKITDAS